MPNATRFSTYSELFEMIYLSLRKEVKGDLQSTFGNSTPLALLEFLLGASPLLCEMMDWRKSRLGGAASETSSYYFTVYSFENMIDINQEADLRCPFHVRRLLIIHGGIL